MPSALAASFSSIRRHKRSPTSASSSARSSLRWGKTDTRGLEMRLLLGLLIPVLLFCVAVPTFLTILEAATRVHFVDLTDTPGVRFNHVSAPEEKSVVDFMSRRVA